MSIAPISLNVFVKLAPDRAFAVFATRTGDWWAKGRTIGANPHEAIVMEPFAGGRWFERDAEGNECEWGVVIAWEPPHRLVLGWQLDASFKYDPDLQTEVELSFVAEGTGTRVTLEHRHLERFGPSAEKIAAQLSGGWPKHLNEFAEFANHGEDA